MRLISQLRPKPIKSNRLQNGGMASAEVNAAKLDYFNRKMAENANRPE
jgi:hypothetical protein